MTQPLPPLDDLLACPECDTLHRTATLPENARAYCQRCGTLLLTSRPAAIAQILSLSLTGFVLMIIAVTFPFLALDAGGMHSAASVLDAVMAFRDGWAFPLSLAVAGFIIVLPLLRLAALIYALGPLVRDAKPHRHAREAFGLAETLRPWSMAEIFVIGVSIALVKIAGMATVTIGPAFWAFTGVVLITVLKNTLINRYAIWETFDQMAR